MFVDVRIRSKHRTNKKYITKNHVSDVRRKKKNLNKNFISRQKMCLLMFAFVQNIVRTKNISQKIMSMTYAKRKKISIKNSLANKKCVCWCLHSFKASYEQRVYHKKSCQWRTQKEKKNLNKKFISKQEMCLLMFAFVQNIVRTKNISQKSCQWRTQKEKKISIKNSLTNKKCVYWCSHSFKASYEQRIYHTKIMSMMYAERKKNLDKKFISKQEMCLLMFVFDHCIVRIKCLFQKHHVNNVFRIENLNKKLLNVKLLLLTNEKCVC